MKLLVFGASGPLGRAITEAALAAGHQVTAFVRTPGRVGSHARLREVTGDVLDASSVRPPRPATTRWSARSGTAGPPRPATTCTLAPPTSSPR